MNREFDFNEQLAMSMGVGASQVEDILLANIPGALQVISAQKENDRNGTDFWVECVSGNFLSIDTKVRSEDWSKRGADDLALETWSVVPNGSYIGKVGWTLDKNKRTDYILWFWQDTGRWCLLPFRMLCAVFTDCWQEWCKSYKTARQNNKSWKSEVVFVPRLEVWRAIYNKYGGKINT